MHAVYVLCRSCVCLCVCRCVLSVWVCLPVCVYLDALQSFVSIGLSIKCHHDYMKLENLLTHRSLLTLIAVQLASFFLMYCHRCCTSHRDVMQTVYHTHIT